MWTGRTGKRGVCVLNSSFRTQLGSCRGYGYIHVPKKKPPHVLGPSTLWRKCFVVRHLPEVLDPLTKHQWLTKSALERGLPQALTSLPLPSHSLVSDFEERASEILAYQIRKPYNGRGPYSPETVSGLLQSILTAVWPLADDEDYCHLRRSHLTPKPQVESYWRRNGNNYISQTEPLYIMHTNMALGLFSKSDYVGSGLPPVQYSPLHLGLFERGFNQILPFGGTRSLGPFTLAHTVFMMDQKSLTAEDFLTHGLVQLFAQSAAEAVQNGFEVDQDLPYPLVTQGIVTNGKSFTFVCFQLNTLDLRREAEEGGKCNMFWAGPSLELFEEAVPGEGLRNFNRECAELFLKLLLHKPVRRRLRQWGGGGRAMNKCKMATEGMQLAPVWGEENQTTS